ncbi:MAG: sugar phosphate isomerase/epimerase [Ruminococcaceae bacterium]|nr:sugar phosphate isomerase/epimerase [Oscillospiraceae bacterium]
MKIGAQLYTLREFCKTPEGLSESLKKVADIGYTTVQISGTCPFEAQWLKNELDKNGLSCVITHTPATQLKEDPAKVCADHKVFDCQYVGLGWYKFKDGDLSQIYQEFSATYGPIAKTIRENGRYFMYHHHDMEFQKLEGQTILRKLYQDFSPEDMGFTLDTYWIQKGGADPAQYIREFAGRIPCIHLKDYGYTATMEAVGQGNINWNAVFSAAADSQVDYMLVEQDNCNGLDPFDCLKTSYDFLKANGFE